MTELTPCEEQDCYVCMEPTTEVSPCECKAPVHMKCLKSWIKKLDDHRLVCSICHRELEGLKVIKYSRGSLLVDRSRSDNLHSDRMVIVLCGRWFIFIMCGYMGKLIFALIQAPGLLGIPEYWTPFDFTFIVCALMMATVSNIVYHATAGVRSYIRGCCPSRTNYEEFDNPDSDNDDDYDSVV